MFLDVWLMARINGLTLRYFWLDSLGIFLAHYLPYLLIAVFLIFLLINFRRYWWMFLEGAAAVFLSWLLAGAIGFLLPRARPFVNGNSLMILPHAASPSFPSTHAIVFFSLAIIVFIYNKKAGLFFLIAAALISAARVFCGIHWPSDILAGMGLGILMAMLAHFAPRRLWRLG